MSGKPGRSGRPSLYTPQLADEICERLAAGESLRSICSSPHMPDDHRVREWALDDRQGFSPRYARSRALGFERMAEELVEISDADCTFGGQPDSALVQQARLRVDTRKWMLARMLPKQYGDRVTQELVGDGDRPIVTRIELVPVVPRPRAIAPPDDD